MIETYDPTHLTNSILMRDRDKIAKHSVYVQFSTHTLSCPFDKKWEKMGGKRIGRVKEGRKNRSICGAGASIGGAGSWPGPSNKTGARRTEGEKGANRLGRWRD